MKETVNNTSGASTRKIMIGIIIVILLVIVGLILEPRIRLAKAVKNIQKAENVEIYIKNIESSLKLYKLDIRQKPSTCVCQLMVHPNLTPEWRKNMEFQLWQKYSRREIAAKLHGSIRDSLPVSGGMVVCGCFNLAPKFNPGAPKEVTLGVRRSLVAARILSKQVGSIHLFLFEKYTKWEYIGKYRCTCFSEDEKLCAEMLEKNPARKEIGGVLKFEKA